MELATVTALKLQGQMEADLITANETISKQEIEIGKLQQEHALAESKIRALESDALEATANKAELKEMRKRVEDMSHQKSQSEDQERLKEQLRMTQAISQTQQVRASSIHWFPEHFYMLPKIQVCNST